MSDCEKIRETLSLIACGAAEDGEAMRHLAECSSCAEWYESARALSESLAALDAEASAVEPPQDLHDRVVSEVMSVRIWEKRPLWAWAAAAAVLAACAVFYAASTHGRRPGGTGPAAVAPRHGVALPTFAAYRGAAMRGMPEFEALLRSNEVYRPLPDDRLDPTTAAPLGNVPSKTS
jgi:hypothetical protein